MLEPGEHSQDLTFGVGCRLLAAAHNQKGVEPLKGGG